MRAEDLYIGQIVRYTLDLRRDPRDRRILVERSVAAEIVRIHPGGRVTIRLLDFPEWRRRATRVVSHWKLGW